MEKHRKEKNETIINRFGEMQGDGTQRNVIGNLVASPSTINVIYHEYKVIKIIDWCCGPAPCNRKPIQSTASSLMRAGVGDGQVETVKDDDIDLNEMMVHISNDRYTTFWTIEQVCSLINSLLQSK